MRHNSCHAEINVLKRYINSSFRESKYRKLSKIKMYSLRVRINNGKMEFGMAEPCCDCCRTLNRWGIRKVWYTDSDGKLVKSDLSNTHISRGNRMS